MSLAGDATKFAALWFNPLYNLRNKRARAFMILLTIALVAGGFLIMSISFYKSSTSQSTQTIHFYGDLFWIGFITEAVGAAMAFIPGIVAIIYMIFSSLFRDLIKG